MVALRQAYGTELEQERSRADASAQHLEHQAEQAAAGAFRPWVAHPPLAATLITTWSGVMQPRARC